MNTEEDGTSAVLPDHDLERAAQIADANAGSADSVPDGTEPDGEIDATLVEEGDAGVDDKGDEPWYDYSGSEGEY